MNIKETAKTEITSLQKELVGIGLTCSEIEEKQYNYEFVTFSEKDKIKVQIYFGKNGVKTVLQGNKESLLYKEIQSVIFEQATINFLENTNEPKEYIGSDESGKGDVFGPLITTAFYVDEKAKMELLQLGVKDSKALNEKQITEIAGKLRKNFANNFETIILYPEKYNELYSQFNNLNSLLTWTHSTAISNLLQKFNCDAVIVDKFSNQAIKISGKISNDKINILQTTNGERFVGVAAASIIARDTFNKWFLKIKKNYFELPKGASGNVEETVKIFIKKYSFDEIKKIAKVHFKTVKKFY